MNGDGVDVVVNAGQATRVEICFFEGTRALSDSSPTSFPFSERRFRLHEQLYGFWSGHISGITAGAVYGFRAYGPWAPEQGLLYNPAKVMLDPYARAIAQMPILSPSLYAHKVDEQLCPLPEQRDTLAGREMDNHDSAGQAALGMVIPEPPDAGHVQIPWNKTVLYEAHVIGLTKQLEGVPEHLRGTYAGVAHPATIEHLKNLGVTSIELLPIFAKMSEPFLIQKGLSNYWGYNTLNYFAPEPSYATRTAQDFGPQAVIDEVRGMVSILHQAGIEVILDVVYNHTNEAGVDGPSTSFRGLNNLGYYRYDSWNTGRLKDTTGCGNSFDFRRSSPIALTLDSLRYWVRKIGIDGFRFDLAVTLGREGDAFDTHNPLFTAMLSDPILRGVKLINEPWDLGPNGWQTGNFPAGTADWNDRFRDTVRTFWLAEPAAIQAGATTSHLSDLSTRLSGSADLFSHGRTRDGRGVHASINFVTAHDGFSMWDLTSYNSKHNEANLEDNRDGSDSNLSWNHGVEGFEALDDLLPEAAEKILAARRRSVRNMLGTLALSAGTPMLRAGDELLTSQGGNNNAYCQDSPISYLQWSSDEHAKNIHESLAYLLRLRAEHSVLRPVHFYTGKPQGSDELSDVAWFDAAGMNMPASEWTDPAIRSVQMLRSGDSLQRASGSDKDALIVINGSLEPMPITLAQGRGKNYELMWSSHWESPRERDALLQAGEVTFKPGSLWEAPALSIALFFA